jgi:hypothetical protein
MDQSLAFTVDLYSSLHFGMRRLHDSLGIAPVWKNVIYYGGTAAGLLAFAYVLPFGYPWMQQEFTRSILSRFDIKSINGSYNIFNPSAVRGGTDVELVRLKAENPRDLVRMQEANVEGYVIFSDRMLRNRFFYDLHDLSNVTALLSVWISLGISGVGVVNQYWPGRLNIDDITQSWYENDPQGTRFPYGFSALNWVYDLFRPDEPYADRGLHPSGDGAIARYITMSQLSDREKEYLITQRWLSYT